MYYRRVLLKLSGEMLGYAPKSSVKKAQANKNDFEALDSILLENVAKTIARISQENLQISIVVGGGNWFRGPLGQSIGLERITSDYIGMLSTVMNALALRDKLLQQSLTVQVMSAIPITGLVEPFNVSKARRYLAKGCVVIFSAGIGHPFVSTDVAASLRALETKADILLKATTVDGIYSSDPLYNKKAVRYERLTYEEVLKQELKIMDLAAFIQCRDHRLPIRVFNMSTPDNLVKIIHGVPIGTLVS